MSHISLYILYWIFHTTAFHCVFISVPPLQIWYICNHDSLELTVNTTWNLLLRCLLYIMNCLHWEQRVHKPWKVFVHISFVVSKQINWFEFPIPYMTNDLIVGYSFLSSQFVSEKPIKAHILRQNTHMPFTHCDHNRHILNWQTLQSTVYIYSARCDDVAKYKKRKWKIQEMSR